MRLNAFYKAVLFSSPLMGFIFLFCAVSCTKNDSAFQTAYGLYRGKIDQYKEQNFIERKVYLNKEKQLIAVVSSISTISEMAGFRDSTLKTIYDFCTADSVFSFDASDSSLFAFSLRDLQYIHSQSFPMTSFWLFRYLQKKKGFRMNAQLIDTLWIAGKKCRKIENEQFAFWVFKNQPMAIQSKSKTIRQNEEAIRFVTDTVLPQKIFQMPSGFSKMLDTPLISEY
ncbi:MAG TPA: hypothetical protein DCG69_04405 [Bacteroidales bacterium]|nr:hypothetical protein [Bacteroidales bacterium]